jgi:hypothetical protein
LLVEPVLLLFRIAVQVLARRLLFKHTDIRFLREARSARPNRGRLRSRWLIFDLPPVAKQTSDLQLSGCIN